VTKGESFQFKDGIEEYVAFLNRNKVAVHNKVIVIHDEAAADESKPDKKIVVDIALQYNDGYAEQLYAYANSIFNLEGGTHLSGFPPPR